MGRKGRARKELGEKESGRWGGKGGQERSWVRRKVEGGEERGGKKRG